MPYFKGTNNDDKLIGSVGADEIYGFDGDDMIKGMEGFNTIWAGDGADTIIAGKGRDLIYGEGGDDLINIIGNYSGTFIVGGFGRDSVSLDRAAAGTFLSLDYNFRYDLGGADPLNSIEVLIRNDSMSIDKTDSSSAVFRDNIDGLSNLGSDGMVQIFGTQGDDRIEINRTAGPMIKFFAEGNDNFDGSSDTYEEITFGVSSRYYSGDYESPYNEINITNNSGGQMSGRIMQTEADYSTSTTNKFTTRFTAIDMIEGSNGDDVATGSSGADKFRPGYGNDGFNGGKGSDTVYYDATGIYKTVVDLQYHYAKAWFSNDAALEDYNGLYYSDRFVFEDQPQYDGLRSIENVVGTDAGSDILRGSNAKNTLDGGGGDDILNGRKGNDTLIGGDGDDDLRGFGGRDRFQFDSADGTDRIFKFEDGVDKIVVGDGLTFADVEITDLGRHTLVTFGDTEVKLLGFDHNLVTGADFQFV